MEVLEKVAEIIKDEFDTEENITRETTLIEDLDADSLDAVELIMRIEEEFEFEIEDEVAQNIKTVGDIIDFIEDRV